MAVISAAAALLFVLAGVTVTVKDKKGRTLWQRFFADGATVVVVPGEHPEPDAPPGEVSTPAPVVREALAAGQPLSLGALVRTPTSLPGVRSWTVETVAHRAQQTQLAYSPDGRWLATGDNLGAVRIWDARTRKLVRMWRWSDSRVFALSWSPTQPWLAVGYTLDGIVLWNVEEGRMVHHYTVPRGHPWQLSWSKDGGRLGIALGDGNFRIVGVPDGEVLDELQAEGVAWLAPSGDEFADVLHTGEVRFVSLATGETRVAVPTDPLWINGQTGSQVDISTWFTDVMRYVNASPWSPDGRMFLLLGDTKLQVVDSHEGRVAWHNEEPLTTPGARRTSGGAWLPDGTRLAAMYSAPAGRGVEIFDAATGRRIVEGPPVLVGGQYPALAWSCDGPSIAVTSGLAGVFFCDAATGELRDELLGWPPTRVQAMVLSQDALLVNGIRLTLAAECRWDLAMGTVAAESNPYGETPYGVLAYSQDGEWAVVDTSGTKAPVLRRDPATGRWEEAAHIDAASGNFAVCISPDHRLVARSELDDPRVRIWDTQSSQIVHELALPESPFGLAISPDNQRIAVSYLFGGGGVQVFNLATGELVHEGPPRDVRGPVAYSPDGRWLAVTGGGTLTIFAADALQQSRQIQAHAGLISALAWSADGSLLATAGAALDDGGGPSDAVVRLWSVATGELLGTLVVLDDDRWLVVSPEGHVRETPLQAAARDLVYLVDTDGGEQLTLTPAEFAVRYGWTNDPDRVRLADAPETTEP